MRIIFKNLWSKFRRNSGNIDYMLVAPYVILSLFGILMVYSASSINQVNSGQAATTYALKQFIFTLIGFLAFGLSTTKPVFLGIRNRKVLIMSGIIMFILLVVARLSPAINGAHGWIRIPGINISLQPSEFFKLYLILLLAKTYWMNSSERKELYKSTSKWNIWIVLGICFVMCSIILSSPDVGGTIINFLITFIMISIAAKISCRGKILLVIGVPIALFGSAFTLLKYFDVFQFIGKEYMYQRFIAFYTPFQVAQSSGKQLVNSYYAISNGGLFGLGLGNSIQKRGYLPEPYTDFILSIVTEELGLITTTIVLLLLCIIILRIIYIGIGAKNLYSSLVCYGIAVLLFVESALNIAAVNGLAPITGVTLPFISYGGSSMLTLSVALGIVNNIYYRSE